MHDNILLEKLNWLISENITSGELSGPAIERMKSVLLNLYYIDDVQERNNIGLNKSDKDTVTYTLLNYLEDDSATSLPIRVVSSCMAILSRYRNTQFTGYTELEKQINSLIGNVVDTATDGTAKIIVDHTQKEYGKILVKFHENISSRSKIYKDIKAAQDQYFERKNIPKEYDKFGNYDYPRFKFFSKSRTAVGEKEFYVKEDLVDELLAAVFPNIAVEHIGAAPPVSRPSDTSTAAPVVAAKPKLKFIEIAQTPYGKKIRLKLGNDVGKSIETWNIVKQQGMSPKIMSFDYQNKNHLLTTVKDDYEKIKRIFVSQGFDTSEIDEKIEAEGVSASSADTSGGLLFSNAPGRKITIKYKQGNSEENKAFLKQSIQYLFADYVWNGTNFCYEVEGSHRQYGMFIDILKKFNFDVKDLEKIVNDKLNSGTLSVEKKEGELSAEEKDQISNLDSIFPKSKFSLFGIQKEGIEFLLSRKSAILGSETGAGKTVQLIYAAALKTQQNRLPVLIVTLKSVQAQWVQEIKDVMGEDVADDISTEPSIVKKWNVCYYENFSAGNNLEQRLEKMKNTQYGVLILDELHKVKHASSKRSENIAEISKHIPYKWGASATVSSNKPLDVKNQLFMLDHSIGKIPEGKFKRDFSGMVPEGYGGSYVPGTTEQQIIAAENLNKWMVLTGVYIRQSKQDMKNEKGEQMSNLNIEEAPTDINNKELETNIKNKLATYKDKELAISKLIAFREAVAKLKVDKTTEEVVKIVTRNQNNPEHNFSASKVLVFTNFVESGELLKNKITDAIKDENPSWNVYTYLSSTPKDQIKRVKTIMEDKNSKVLIMSMKMGGTGISFPNTFANMIINDYDWTPEAAEQSEGRIYRINTEQDVNIKYIIAQGGDEQLFENVKLKRELATIIQRYRKDFINDINNVEALNKIVSAQKELMRVENEMENIISGMVGSTVSEGFAEFFTNYIMIREYLQ